MLVLLDSHLICPLTTAAAQNHLGGQIPKQMGSLSNPNRLCLSFNEIRGPLPAEFGQILNLSEYMKYTFIGDFSQNQDLMSFCPQAMSSFRRVCLLELFQMK